MEAFTSMCSLSSKLNWRLSEAILASSQFRRSPSRQIALLVQRILFQYKTITFRLKPFRPARSFGSPPLSPNFNVGREVLIFQVLPQAAKQAQH
jgi:hypothetical protein